MLALTTRIDDGAGAPQRKKLRIMLIGDSFTPKVDGVATFTENTVLNFKRRGHEVHVITSIVGPETLFGATVTRLFGLKSLMCPTTSLTLPSPTIIWELIRYRPHIVHVFEGSRYGRDNRHRRA